MNDGGKRRYADQEILDRFENPQRPHAGHIDQAELDVMIWSDLHGDVQSAAEMSAPPPQGGSNNHERS
jgi:hypothetical protein